MRNLIITTLIVLGFAGSAFGQYRIVKLNSSQVQGQEPKADSITVIWDDREGGHRWSSMSLEGPMKFVTGDGLSISPESPVRYQDGRPLGDAFLYLTSSRETGDTILGHQTALIQAGPSAVHYSKDLSTDLKIVTIKENAVEISEAISIDRQADFDPRTVDLSAFEQAGVNAEAAGQKDYARQILQLVRRWRKAAAN